ncbi:MAG TPA: Gfo/Idh/MocA family oxidoreductase [Clostridiaceae bacterium]|nr:Gfo/Idh/MocA family oxidoreductase [Clostridiaceae bacterium]
MKVKWGIIGAGGIADRRTIPGMKLSEKAELVAVMEVNMELAEKLRAKYSAKRAYDNVDDLLKDPEVEAVYIASPVVYHKEQAIKAARAKKHILIEKPVALTSKEAEEVAAVCKEEGVKIAVGLMMRYHSYHRKMKEIIASGKLGNIVSCRAQFTCWYPDIPGAWRQKKSTSGGGALMDMGVHCIDLIQYVTGSKAKKVVAFNATKTFKYEVEDSSSVLFETDNGAFVYVDSNFNIPDAASKSKFEIYGTKGSMVAIGTLSQVEEGDLEVLLSDDTLEYDAQQNRIHVAPVKIDVEFGNMYTKEIDSFCDSILYNKPIEVPVEDAIQVQKVIEAAYKSSENQIFVNL